MEMSKPGICCDGCFTLLAKRSTNASKLWLDLCEVQITCNIFGLRTDDNPHFHLLETLGFITTTETSDLIIFRVNGMEQDGLGAFFCGGNCDV